MVGEAEDGVEAIKKVKKICPHIIIMDIGMPGLNGIEATREILEFLPGAKIIALSMHEERKLVVEMLKAGASAYLLKDSAYDELIQAIEASLLNKVFLTPRLSEKLIPDLIKNIPRETLSAFSILSRREREVLQLIAEGKGTKEIARRLFLSVKTVETHRKKIMEKLNLYSVAELTKYAIREGLTSLEK